MPKTICSVFFEDLKATRSYALQPNNDPTRPGGFNHTFTIPAAKPGKYETCRIPDVMYEHQYIIKGKTMSTPVYGEHVAPCVVGEWRDVINHAYGGPGIFVCAGDEPTDAELRSARARQALWCEKLINDAENAWINGKRDDIKQLHRNAAAFQGKLAFAWMQDDGEVVLRPCPGCYTKVNSEAFICPQCRTIIDFAKQQDFFIRQEKAKSELMASIQRLEEVDPAAAAEVRAATASNTPAQPPQVQAQRAAPPLQPTAPKTTAPITR